MSWCGPHVLFYSQYLRHSSRYYSIVLNRFTLSACKSISEERLAVSAATLKSVTNLDYRRNASSEPTDPDSALERSEHLQNSILHFNWE